jgi:hypothetical protein
MKRYSKVGLTICKAGTDSDLCAAICGPVPEFLCVIQHIVIWIQSHQKINFILVHLYVNRLLIHVLSEEKNEKFMLYL